MGVPFLCVWLLPSSVLAVYTEAREAWLGKVDSRANCGAINKHFSSETRCRRAKGISCNSVRNAIELQEF